jgi:pimeloyl-ACP methyl ester carboxylesterase
MGPASQIGAELRTLDLELPPDVVTALGAPAPGSSSTVTAGGIPFHLTSWPRPSATPLLLLHGVTSNADTWWRMGPALAAAGFSVVAPDMPGHGMTGSWRGRHRFRETAAEVATLVEGLGLEAGSLAVVGHSWGGMTAASLPSAGLRPARLVLLDPPTVPLAWIAAMLDDPVEGKYADLDEAVRVIGRLYPTWPYRDVIAKAVGLTQFDESAVRAILTENGDWDGGLGGLADPAAEGIPTWLVRGDPAAGGYVPDDALPRFASRIGADHIITLPGAPHSPQRTHPEATVAALLRALGATS